MGRKVNEGRLPRRNGLRPRGNTLVAKCALLWLVPAAILSVLELVTTGRINAPVLALDAIAGVLLPFGLLSLGLALTEPVAKAPPDEGDGGGGDPRRDTPPTPPPTGSGVDWEQFEADFRAYARERELAGSLSQ